MQSYPYLTFGRSADTSLLGLFLEADELYFIEAAGTDWRYGYTSRRMDATVTITVGNDALISGIDILVALRSAMAAGSEEMLANVLTESGLPENPLKLAGWMRPVAPTTEQMAYRTFLSTRDLERLLSFPAQKATAGYKRVLIVDATLSPRPDSGLVMPDTPPHWRYMIVRPEGVKVDAGDEVDFGRHINITYTAPGCEPAEHHVSAGKPSPFVTYYGAALCIHPLSRLGIKLSPVAAKEEKPASTETKGRKVNIMLRFTGDRTLICPITLNPESSEYSLLRSGTWHGYRARRLAVKTQGDESYLVDLRINRPEGTRKETELPGQSNTERSRRRRRTSPWIYVCAALLAIILGVVIVGYLPKYMPAGNPDYAPGTVDSAIEAAESEPTPILTAAPDTVAVTDTATVTEAAQPEPSAEPAPEPAPAAGISAADKTYFDTHTTWRRDKLQSSEAQQLFDLLSTGDLKSIASNPYLADRSCANATAVKIVKLIWEAKGADTQVSNQKALRQLKGQESIDLQELHRQLARVRPTNPNKSERP